MAESVRICYICKESKTISNYTITKNKNGSERIRNECKACRSAQESQRRKDNIEKYHEKDKIY